MLAVSTLGDTTTGNDESQGQVEGFSTTHDGNEEFPDFTEGNLLDSIDFDDLFVGINDRDVLPDLEMEPELLAEFSVSRSCDDSDMNTSFSNRKVSDETRRDEEDKIWGSGSGSGSDSSTSNIRGGEEIVSKRDESGVVNPVPRDGDKGRKSSTAHVKNNDGKRKVKVDWTPELHRRFVQAVEQLGVDKAVPSRILEIMGIDCLTRHNIASHLQKYRSHRKHLLAREAEAASWSQRRQKYGAGGASGGGSNKNMGPWLAPTMGFPPVTPMHHNFTPLHVWGHPSMDQSLSLMHVWPKHLTHSQSRPPPPTWAPPPPGPSYWNHHNYQRVPNGLTPGTPCFPQPLAPPTRFAATPPVPGIPPHAMYKVDPGIGVPTGQSGPPHPLFDFHPDSAQYVVQAPYSLTDRMDPSSGNVLYVSEHQLPYQEEPSKESIDAAIGDVLSKPWLPLPLGLKPPSIDFVLGELQRQGIPKIPPSCA